MRSFNLRSLLFSVEFTIHILSRLATAIRHVSTIILACPAYLRQILSISTAVSTCTLEVGNQSHARSDSSLRVCWPHRISPHLTSPHLTSPHLTSSHLISPHPTLPFSSYISHLIWQYNCSIQLPHVDFSRRAEDEPSNTRLAWWNEGGRQVSRLFLLKFLSLFSTIHAKCRIYDFLRGCWGARLFIIYAKSRILHMGPGKTDLFSLTYRQHSRTP